MLSLIKITALFISIMFFSNFAHARFCANIFSSPTDKSLYTNFEKIKNSKGNILLIHGLGDTSAHLNLLAQQFKKAGYSVLRVDLHGHGKTLENFAKTSESIPDVLPYENNIKDISEILKKHNFKNPIIVGHSYGGAIAYALSNHLQGQKQFRPKKLIMMAPYLRRLDFPYLTGNPILDMPTEYSSEQFMRTTYREYFESQNRQNIDLLVDAAIAATKGIRSFDLLSSGKKASLDYQIPLLILAGTKDELIGLDQIKEFHKKLTKEEYDHKVITIDDGHFFPRTRAQETFLAIMASIK